MKKLLLFGLGTSLVASTSAWAQPNPYTQSPTVQLSPGYIYVLPTLPTVAAATGLEAVAGKPDTFKLQRGRYDAKELMQVLAAKAGGKAIFVEGFVTKPLDLLSALQGTLPELLAKMADLGVAAGKLGPDWVFVPVQPKSSFASQLFLKDSGDFSRIPNLDLRRYLPLSPTNPLSPELKNFNINPTPGQNLPPGATPFEFNGDRLYFTPLGPKTR